MGPVYDTASLRHFTRLPKDDWEREAYHTHMSSNDEGKGVLATLCVMIFALIAISIFSASDTPKTEVEVAQAEDVYSSRP